MAGPDISILPMRGWWGAIHRQQAGHCSAKCGRHFYGCFISNTGGILGNPFIRYSCWRSGREWAVGGASAWPI
jgi:hypothetical protein